MERDLIIQGNGSTAGGDFRDVKINGIGKVAGDVNCARYIVRGKSEVNGNISAKFVQVAGSSLIRGNLKASEVSINGRADITGALTGERIKVNGKVRTHGNSEAKFFDLNGACTIDGKLKSKLIHMTLDGRSQVRTIAGETIRTRIRSDWMYWLLSKLGSRTTPVLQVDTLEGDDLELVHTHAKIIRGHHVRLGPGCQVERVEYEKLDLHPDAEVKVKEKR